MEIRIVNLSYSYRKGSCDALSGVSAALGPGIHLLLGENGAGKTTLLHIIAGLRFPTVGKCLIDGGPTRHRLPSVLSHIGFFAPDTGFPAETIAEMVRIHAQFYPRFSVELLDSNLNRLGLDATTRLKSMSMGQRQKAGIAYIMSLGTDILLLDEPATGLDIESKQELQRMFAEIIQPHQTVIVSTHNISDLERLYDSVTVLNHGHLMVSLPVDEILQRVAFVTSSSIPEGSLYSESTLGGYRSVVAANEATGDSDVDFRLLYTAMHQPDCENLKEILK